jgi:hypothetical protein
MISGGSNTNDKYIVGNLSSTDEFKWKINVLYPK